MKTVVLGSGGWGTALSQILCDNGHETYLWSHSPAKAAEMARARRTRFCRASICQESLHITGDLDCLKGADLVVSAPPSFAVRETAKKMAPYLTEKTVVVSVSKGIERDTNLRLSQVIQEETGNICKVAVLSGPSHAEEVGIRLPTGCVAACLDVDAARFVQDAFMNDYFRVYTSGDVVGVELAAALKNVIALSCGVCDGLGYQDNTKALLMTRAMAEITRLGEKLGAPADLRRLGRYGGSDRDLHLHALPESPGGHPHWPRQNAPGGHGGSRRRGGGILRRGEHSPAQ